MENFRDFKQIEQYIATQMIRMAYQKRHPWRLATLADVEGNLVRQRTVVIRSGRWEDRSIRFYTDRRSRKMSSVEAGRELSFLFYNPLHQVQLRLTAQPMLAQERERERIWNQLPDFATTDYRSLQCPGEVLKNENGLLSREEGFAHFCIVDNVFSSVDFLCLERDGHTRAQLHYDEEKHGWTGQWLVP